ncbi:MAG: hypothetical protein PHS04_03915 [Tissierellia bacterium]|nr:hypothetical protein [Tissierellia bacterium]MDD4437166.1 hypothetical protein [Tissierellia bacterium]
MNIIASVILIILGVIMIIKPLIIWKIADSWKTKNKTEPANYYLNMIRVGGFILTVGGIAAAIELIL